MLMKDETVVVVSGSLESHRARTEWKHGFGKWRLRS